MKLNKKLVKIQTELKAPKNQYNSFGKYKYRSAEDILEAVKPLLADNDVALTITENTKEIAGFLVLTSTAIFTDGEDTIVVNAQAGVNPQRKGMDIAQSFGASSSYAKKYALGNLFLLDDTKDADSNKKQDTVKSAMTPDQFNKAKEYVANGGDVQSIVKKYQVTTEQVVELKTIKGQ
tara:strand:+ start:4893 stop:5426 length:534 start_codon:yes stop_codon:yes gene_type:complete